MTDTPGDDPSGEDPPAPPSGPGTGPPPPAPPPPASPPAPNQVPPGPLPETDPGAPPYAAQTPGAPAYGAPEPPGTPGGSGRTGLRVALGAVAVVAVGALVWFPVRDDDGETATGGSSPEAVVATYLEAQSNDDCETTVEVTTPAIRTELVGASDREKALQLCEQSMQDLVDRDIIIRFELESTDVVEEDGDTATLEIVAVQENVEGGESLRRRFQQEIGTVRQEGDWKVDRMGEPELLNEDA